MEVGGIGFKVAVSDVRMQMGEETEARSRGVNQEREWEMGATWRPEGRFGQVMKYLLAFNF